MLELDVIEAMKAEVNAGPEWCRPSNIWTELVDRQTELLRAYGVASFKRTVNHWFAVESGRLPERIARLQGLLGKAEPSVMPICGTRFQTDEAQQLYPTYIGLLWDFCVLLDDQDELRKFSEPPFGTPIDARIDGRLVTVDLCKSFIEYQTIVEQMGRPLRGCRILEIGAGSGRLALMMGTLVPDLTYVIADIPPALYIAQKHIESVFPDRVAQFTPNLSADALALSLARKQFVFLTPNQLPLIESQSIDVAINIDSFAEMAVDHVRQYIRILREKTALSALLYFRNAADHMNSKLGTRSFKVPAQSDYDLGPGFEWRLHRQWPLEPWYIERVQRKVAAAGDEATRG